MQSKGAITLVAILIGLACLFQLSFTAATAIQESKAAKAAAKVVEEVQQSPSFAEVSEFNRAFYLDSVNSAANKQYLDSIANKKVYFNYTYKNVKEKELNLGLDLKGGMNIVLQLDLAELVRSCAREKTTEEFNQAMALAAERADQTHEDFISLFAQAWDEVAPGKRLSFDIDLDKLSGDVKNKSRATNEEIISLLKEEAKSAIDNSYQVVERRVNQFGVAQPNIQKVAGTGRILVELPGVKEPERVRKLLQGTASLEFWETYTSQELQPYLQELNETVRMQLEALEGTEADEQPAVEQPKAASDTSSLEAELAASADETSDANRELLMKANPLFSRLQPMGGNSALLGIAHYRDTAQINAWINANRNLFPGDFFPAWSFKAFDGEGIQPDTYFELVALKSHVGKGPALDGKYISSANVNYNQMTGAPEVSMAMNSKGAIEWENITGENVGRQIAIVMDGQVYSYPNVQNKISGGNSSISGNFTQTDADDLANVLKSGKLSTPARIVQEQVVGPSLGSESIRHGLISFVIAFILVLIYMIIFYRKAGVAADIALLCNVLFLFGALASFGTVFTLSGIAGLVLTMGMAVDANVIIYERIKEELNAGKALRLAISDGYKNAYSAILDGQITTILTGIILYLFGSGTIKGFAAVLVIGIITSVFTSIFITRLIFEARLKRNKDITFASEWSSRFLKNTHIDFLGMRKKTYLISGIVCLICLAFIFTKGFSLGVDFSGGRTYTVRFDQPVTPEQVRAALLDEFQESSEVKQFGGTSQMRITTKYMVNDKSDATDRLIEGKLFNALKGFYANPVTLEGFTSTLENPNGIISSDRVDASIASEVRRDAVIAVILALIVIFGYIAFRFKNWSWGVGGVSSLIHNSIIVIGFYSIFSGVLPFTLDVDQTFIAAVLTIIGYSINDNVVIFDRIREYRTLFPKRPLEQNINEALNATLSRTINTSVSTLLVLLAIAFFGGESIRGFSVSLALGVLVGTYASIFIGTPIMYDLNRRKIAKAEKAAK
ncbi:MAG: protein translocase subunit SecDF [Bacteroidales bacterium]|nr:protein translocase subunit SecDF [Bacteroidales bacterium]MBQ2194844.1 protein translocase subunit SecDF [Bacteroidales bacterium]